MEDQRERIRGRRRYELTNRNVEPNARAHLHYAGAWSQSSWRGAWEDREASVAHQRHQRHQRQLIEQQQSRAITMVRARQYARARAVSRQAMNEIKKTVEIADGSADFRLLMVAAYGKGVMRSWEYGRAIFEDVTGLRLKKETEDDEDCYWVEDELEISDRRIWSRASHRIDADSKL